MKRIMMGIVCVLLSGFANAQLVHHPENTNIVGLLEGGAVCFKNDGFIGSPLECTGDTNPIDEGFINIATGKWFGGSDSGINECGTSAVNPVSSTTCSFTKVDFASCLGNGYTLVQTTKSGHFWAARADVSCTSIAKIVPCRSTDAFNIFDGCVSDNPSEIGIEGGYIKLDTYSGYSPPTAHCAQESHYGRMAFEPALGVFYICGESGWITK